MHASMQGRVGCHGERVHDPKACRAPLGLGHAGGGGARGAGKPQSCMPGRTSVQACVLLQYT